MRATGPIAVLMLIDDDPDDTTKMDEILYYKATMNDNYQALKCYKMKGPKLFICIRNKKFAIGFTSEMSTVKARLAMVENIIIITGHDVGFLRKNVNRNAQTINQARPTTVWTYSALSIVASSEAHK